VLVGTTVNGTNNQATVTIPAGTASGASYLLRILTLDGSGAASTIGSNSAAFTIVNNPTVSITPAASQTYAVGGSGTQLTANETFTTGTTRVWQLSTTSASAGFSNIAGETGTTYTPTFGTVGTYYVRVQSTFPGCGAIVSSNTVQVTVTAAANGTVGTPTYLTGANPSTASPGGFFCSNGGINLGVSFTTTGTFNAGNNFIIELSNASGSFSTPFATVTVAGTTAPGTPVALAIPAGTSNGGGYLIRVRSTSPANTSASSVALGIVNNPQVTITPPITQTYTTGSPGVPFVAVESFGAISRQWQVGPTITGPFTSIPGATGLSFSPTFNTPGTYFVNLVSVFAACGTKDSDNEAQVNVNSSPVTFANAPLCATTAATLDVTFTATGTYGASNTFTIQLSNAAGSFTTPIVIGSIANNLTTAQTVTTTIPAGTPTGSGYLIRVVSDSPVASTATSASLAIVSNPTVSITPAGAQTISTGANGAVLTAGSTNIAGTTRVWQVATTSGGPFTNITPAQTGTSYTPNFATAGTYFVRVLNTFPGCGDVASNEVQFTVSMPTPTISSLTINAGFAGSTIPTFTVNGSMYTNSSVIYFDGVAQPTTFATAGRLTVANLVLPTAPGSYNVTVVNPGGVTSNAVAFMVMPSPLVTYATTPLSGTSTSVSPSNVAANSSASILTRVGVTANSGSGVFASSNFPFGTGGVAPLDPAKYLAFTYTVASGYTVSPTGVLLSISRSSTGSPQTVELRASTDGTNFTNPVSLGVQNLSGTSTAQYAFAVPGGALQAVTSPLYFRLYAYNGTTSGPTIRLEDLTSSIPAVIVNGTIAAGVPVAEINLTQGTTNIASSTGSYAFAPTLINTATAATQFNIQNTGNFVLNLTGTPPDLVTIAGPNASEFSLTQPSASSVAAVSSLPFTITFNPTSVGTKTATISIANSDSDEDPYTFTLTASGVAAPVVTSFTPLTGPVGTNVTITGTDFTAGSTVSFNGTAATVITFNSATSLTATVPVGTTTGPITVATAYGSSTSTASFVVLATPTAGQLLLEDNFAYAASEPLTTHGWTGYSGTSSPPPATIAGNQTIAQYPRGFDQSEPTTFAGSTSARLSNVNNQDVSRSFGAGASTTLYAAAVINVTATASGGDYFLSLADATNTSLRGRIYIQRSGTAASGNFQFGVGTSASGSYTTGTPYSGNTPYLVVLKYTVNSNNTETASLFVYNGAASLNEPAQPVLTSSGPLSASAPALTNIVLRQADNALIVDGLRVATNWGTVIGRPEYLDETTTLRTGSYYSVTVNGATSLTTAGAASVEGSLNLNGGNINTNATNLLSLTATATITGGSATSFVNGPLARITGTGAATSVFPIGKGTNYRPLTLTAASQAAASTYIAEQVEGNPGQTLATPLKRVSARRSYTVTSSNTTAGNFSGTITLSFGADDYVNTPSSTDLVIAKRDGGTTGTWNSIGRGTATGNSSGPGGASVSGTLTSGTFSDFSDFALGALNDLTDVNTFAAVNPLPVELAAFTAQRQSDKAVLVQWTTASERNSAHFDVQRSLNGRDFATIATLKAQGTSTRATAYTAPDATAPAAQLYYRLRQVDADGTVAYSPVATVAGTNAELQWSVYPNPASTKLTVALPAAEGRTYRVLNTVGKVVSQGPAAEATPAIDVRQLPTGTYFLELRSTAGTQVRRFVKID
jgi:hypothetical protein